MSDPKIRWEPYGSMHFGYLSGAEIGVFSYIIQGPDRGMYSLYVAPGGDILKIEDFEDLAKAIFAAERMEESKK